MNTQAPELFLPLEEVFMWEYLQSFKRKIEKRLIRTPFFAIFFLQSANLSTSKQTNNKDLYSFRFSKICYSDLYWATDKTVNDILSGRVAFFGDLTGLQASLSLPVHS